MKKCGEDCIVACDFCIFYKDDGEEEPDGFSGEGKCLLYEIKTEANFGSDCNGFECFNYDEE